MNPEELQPLLDSLSDRLTPAFVGAQVHELLRQGEDIGGGVNAFRLMKHLLAGLAGDDQQVMWVYERLKPRLAAALKEVPSLYFFHGD